MRHGREDPADELLGEKPPAAIRSLFVEIQEFAGC
jgi:hypothetical protein